MAWFVYIIETTNGRLYTGITTDPERRFQEHVSGKGGARFFRIDPPKKILYLEKKRDRSTASRREAQIKGMEPAEKRALIRSKKSGTGTRASGSGVKRRKSTS
ncbi:MAG: GIY-YIG nuclease family protein [Spirochaetia bacterium]|nr:GIY-YIG nuclease family protein [Spirochaetia bacterium]